MSVPGLIPGSFSATVSRFRSMSPHAISSGSVAILIEVSTGFCCLVNGYFILALIFLSNAYCNIGRGIMSHFRVKIYWDSVR